jgi:DNA-binding GntR family transcriptional regulator
MHLSRLEIERGAADCKRRGFAEQKTVGRGAELMIELSQEEARLISQPMSRKDIVLGLIRSAIVDGRLPAGIKLDQNEIAATLGVSRMPVREALKQLQAEGLVVVYPYRGVEVARLDPADIREMFAIRGSLERLAVGKAPEGFPGHARDAGGDGPAD